jgi:VWFA-related protein
VRTITRAALGLVLLVSVAASQTPEPTPAPGQDLLLRFDVDLVQVDAVVADRKGHHVADLTADDFEVFQDGRPQTIKHFAYVPPQRLSPAAAGPAASRHLTREQVRRTMVMLLDDSQMEFADFVFAQRALIRYVEREMQPGDLVGVVRTTGGSSAVQQLSADPEFLKAVLRKMVWRPPSPASLGMLEVLKQVVWGLRDLPGRKSVIMISPGIPAPLPSVWNALQEVADFASRSSVTFHTIGSRGLPTLAPYQASERAPILGPSPSLSLSASPQTPVLATHTDYFMSQLVLTVLAQMTAGLFQSDSNDLLGQVRKAAEDAEGYYLIGWYPGAGAFSNKPGAVGYRNLQIKVKRKDLTVRSRRGYYAVTGMNPASLERFAPQAQMQEALFSPFQRGDIAVRLTPSFGYDLAQGAYVKSLLHIRPEGIEFHPEGNACDTIRLEVLYSALPLNWSGPEGAQVHWWRGGLEVRGQARERALRDGLVATLRLPIARPGPFQVRVAVRNMPAAAESAPAVAASLVQRDSLIPVQIPVGSAAAVLEVPDVPKADFALSGVSLRGSGAPSIASDTVARLTAEGDPAIRQFHPGDALTYEFDLLGRATNVESRIEVQHEGRTVYTSEPLDAKPGIRFSGTYRLEASLEAGGYLLGVVARDPRAKGKGRTVAQWIDFEVAK